MTEQMANQTLPATTPSNGAGTQVFSFGEPTPVLGGREVFDYLECWFNGALV
jgi:hypothetical protein